jgi:hypothetical protein
MANFIKERLAGDVAAAIHQRENSEENTKRREKQNQNAVTQRSAALGSRRWRALVAHRATLGHNVRHGQGNQAQTARCQEHQPNGNFLVQLVPRTKTKASLSRAPNNLRLQP